MTTPAAPAPTTTVLRSSDGMHYRMVYGSLTAEQKAAEQSKLDQEAAGKKG